MNQTPPSTRQASATAPQATSTSLEELPEADFRADLVNSLHGQGPQQLLGLRFPTISWC